MSAKTKPRKKRAPFVLHVFSGEVTAKLEAIKAKMPFWHHHFELAVMIRAMVGKDHNPALWTLAALMMEFEEQKQGRHTKRLSSWRGCYPICRSDTKALDSHPAIPSEMRAQATCWNPIRVTLEPKSFLAVWERAREQVLGDIGELLNAAASVADSYFFQCWGNACQAVARYSYNVQRLSGTMDWKNGEWVSGIKLDDSSSLRTSRLQPARALVIEIVKARQRLWFDLEGRIPSHPEVAQLIIQERAKRGTLPKRFDPKKFVKTVATTSKRLGLTTVVVRKVKNGDKSE